MSLSVSVIIPTFNRASMVPDAVASVIQQTVHPLEIIVVDDGSTDDTQRALEPFKQSIRYIKTDNRGVSAARNRGIKEAQGDYIAFLDSDDAWDPAKLKLQIQCMQEKQTRLCFCVSRDEFGNRLDDLDVMDPHLASGEFKSYSRHDCRIFKHPRHPFLQSMLVERALLIRAGGFDESLSVAEDTKLIYRLVLEENYAVVNTPLVTISRNRDRPGLSDTMDPQSAFRRYTCYTKVQSDAYWRLLGIDREASRVVKSNMRYFQSRLAELACALQKKDMAKKYALSSLTLPTGLAPIARALIILILYPVANRVYLRKWYPDQTMPPEPPSTATQPLHF